jgi:molybdate transport system ATP-binding protein
MSLSVEIHKKFSLFSLDVSFSSGNGRLGLLGASGCGKSMTLKCIAGIETPDSGKIIIDGQTVFDSAARINVPPQKRKTGYLFQSYALFPTMTVEQNIGIGMQNVSAHEKKERVFAALERMNLASLGDRYPSQLSGGQQQRVALARMLESRPRIIMLDEPFSALDSFLRSSLERDLCNTLSAFDGTVLFVSHNRDEVYRMCDKMAVLHDGRLSAFGTREEIFRDPKTLASARLTGCKNLEPAFRVGEYLIRVPNWGITLRTERQVPLTLTHAGVRAHHLRIPRPDEATNCFDFTVLDRVASPFSISEYLALDNQDGDFGEQFKPLVRETGDGAFAEKNDHVRLCLPPESILLLEEP